VLGISVVHPCLTDRFLAECVVVGGGRPVKRCVQQACVCFTLWVCTVVRHHRSTPSSAPGVPQIILSAEEGGLSSGVGEAPALSRADALRAAEGAAPNSSASDSEAGPSHPSSRNGLDRGTACPGGVRWASQRAPAAGHGQAQRCDSAPTTGFGTPQVTEAAERGGEDAEEEGGGDSDGLEKADRKERPRKPHLQARLTALAGLSVAGVCPGLRLLCADVELA